MAIAVIIPDRDTIILKQHLKLLLPDATIWIYPDIPAPEKVTMAVVWKHPPGIFSRFPNLQLISSFGAGVEHLLDDPSLPKGIALTRIVDDTLSRSMRNYVMMAVLNIQRQFRTLQHQQRQELWQVPNPIEIPLRVGILGLGMLGTQIAKGLVYMGIPVSGYSQTAKEVSDIKTYSAEDTSLLDFVRKVNTLVCILPLTTETEGILNMELFRAMPRGSFLVNVGRGAQLVEEDLLQALSDELIREAWLDVFSNEPLPPGHPFWKHPCIVITPHIASVTNQEQAARILADNYRRLHSGQNLFFRVDRESGY